MNEKDQWRVIPADAAVLRELARQKLEAAHHPLNEERRRLWYALDEMRAERPMVLAEAWAAFELLPDFQPRCTVPWAQDLERQLRFDLYQFERLEDDHVVEPRVTYNWHVQIDGYGVEVKQHYAERVSGNISSRQWDPPIKNIEADFEKLRPRTPAVDRDGTKAHGDALREIFDGLLRVELRGGFWWTSGLTQSLIGLVGLENMMVYMCTDPQGLHRMMKFLQEDFIACAEWLEREGLLTLNNENDYIGSGSIGYTHALPQPDHGLGSHARLKDLWVLSESQETVACSPAQCEEFVLSYYRPICARFGRTYYGCCEPVHDRWDSIKTLPNLKRVSISPWCDQRAMADALGENYVFSRKPNPALVSTPDFDENLIRNDLRETLTAARGCNIEIIMKDVHTLCNHPDRLPRWVQLARDTIDRNWA